MSRVTPGAGETPAFGRGPGETSSFMLHEKGSSGRTDTYHLWAAHPESGRFGAAVEAEVHHTPGKTWTAAGEAERASGEDHGSQYSRGQYRARYDLATPVDGQQKLLGVAEDRPRSEVYALFADEKFSARVPGFLGTIAHVNERERGTTIESPEGGDLSVHSSRLVQKLQGAGLVSSDLPSEQVNDITKHEPYYGYDPSSEGDAAILGIKYGSRVADVDVEAGRQKGRQIVRDVARARRPAKETPVEHGPAREEFQQTLPGIIPKPVNRPDVSEYQYQQRLPGLG